MGNRGLYWYIYIYIYIYINWHPASLYNCWNFEKPGFWPVWKYGFAYFQRFLKNGVLFQNRLKTYPLPRARQRPGAPPKAAPGVYFQTILKKYPIFQKLFENMQSHIFKLAQIQVFQNFNNYEGMQDARLYWILWNIYGLYEQCYMLSLWSALGFIPGCATGVLSQGVLPAGGGITNMFGRTPTHLNNNYTFNLMLYRHEMTIQALNIIHLIKYYKLN